MKLHVDWSRTLRALLLQYTKGLKRAMISQEELRLLLSRVTCHTLILRAFLAALPWIL